MIGSALNQVRALAIEASHESASGQGRQLVLFWIKDHQCHTVAEAVGMQWYNLRDASCGSRPAEQAPAGPGSGIETMSGNKV